MHLQLLDDGNDDIFQNLAISPMEKRQKRMDNVSIFKNYYYYY